MEAAFTDWGAGSGYVGLGPGAGIGPAGGAAVGALPAMGGGAYGYAYAYICGGGYGAPGGIGYGEYPVTPQEKKKSVLSRK